MSSKNLWAAGNRFKDASDSWAFCSCFIIDIFKVDNLLLQGAMMVSCTSKSFMWGNGRLLRRATCCWTLSHKAKAVRQQGHRLIRQPITCNGPGWPVTIECWLGDRAKEPNTGPVQSNDGPQGLLHRGRPQKRGATDTRALTLRWGEVRGIL